MSEENVGTKETPAAKDPVVELFQRGILSAESAFRLRLPDVDDGHTKQLVEAAWENYKAKKRQWTEEELQAAVQRVVAEREQIQKVEDQMVDLARQLVQLKRAAPSYPASDMQALLNDIIDHQQTLMARKDFTEWLGWLRDKVIAYPSMT